MPSPIPFDDVLEAKKPAGLTLEMINDTAHADAVNRAIGRRDTAQRLFDRDKSASNTNDLIEAEQALDAVRAAAREATRYWRFVAIGRVAYEALRDAHPSSKVERDDYRKKMAAMGRQQSEIGQIVWSAATFPPALIAASCAGVYATEADAEAATTGEGPYLSLERATELWNSDRYNSNELDTLFSAALLVNTSNRTADLGNG
jgi:hypothetical protein